MDAKPNGLLHAHARLSSYQTIGSNCRDGGGGGGGGGLVDGGASPRTDTRRLINGWNYSSTPDPSTSVSIVSHQRPSGGSSFSPYAGSVGSSGSAVAPGIHGSYTSFANGAADFLQHPTGQFNNLNGTINSLNGAINSLPSPHHRTLSNLPFYGDLYAPPSGHHPHHQSTGLSAGALHSPGHHRLLSDLNTMSSIHHRFDVDPLCNFINESTNHNQGQSPVQTQLCYSFISFLGYSRINSPPHPVKQLRSISFDEKVH